VLDFLLDSIKAQLLNRKWDKAQLPNKILNL
jgi:hypothetical protein